MLKKILVTLGAIVLSLGVGILIPKMMGNTVQGVDVDAAQLQVNFEDELQRLMMKELETQEQVAETLVPTSTEEVLTVTDMTAEVSDNETSVESSATSMATPTPKSTEDEVVDINDTEATPLAEQTDDGGPTPVVGNTWIDSKIEDNRDAIADADLATGMSLYNMLDTSYLFGLAAGGLTDAERSEVDAYMTANLSAGQYETVRTLYYKYVYLLQ